MSLHRPGTVHRPEPRRLRWLAWLGGLAGCAADLDAAQLRGPDQVEATIPYTGVGEEARQFPDYGGIKAEILTERDAGAR